MRRASFALVVCAVLFGGGLPLSTADVQAQGSESIPRRTPATGLLIRLKTDPTSTTAIRPIPFATASAVKMPDRAQPGSTSGGCRRGRRMLIGGLIGGAAATPVALLVRRRFENEAANGAPAAAAIVVTGVGAGALIGFGSCE